MFRACLGPEKPHGDELFEAVMAEESPVIPTVATLVEIVGATDLQTKATTRSSLRASFLNSKKNKHTVLPSTHCEVCLGEQRMFQTDVISNNDQPIWTVRTHSLGILHIPELQQVAQEEGIPQQEPGADNSVASGETQSTALLTCRPYVVVKLFTGKQCLGSVDIPFQHILQGTGEREEFPLVTATHSNNSCETKQQPAEAVSIASKTPSILALRFRLAIQGDLDFVNDLQRRRNRNKSVLASTTQSLRSSVLSSSPSSRLLLEPNHADEATDINFHAVQKTSLFSSSKKKDANTGDTLLRLQPPKWDPDLLNGPAVEWMTKANIQQQSLEPSWKWVETGHGKAGTVYLEIIGCDDLPNLDSNLSPENQSDPFVGIVFEDNMVRTKVLFDTLCPRWLPWSTRAFAFNISHPGSTLFLGVFDYDDNGVAVTDYHDPVGRVVINTMNFECGTTYLLHYDLVDSTQMDTPRGTITIRLRIEWNNENEAAKLALLSPPPFLINMDSQKSWAVLHYCLHGGVNTDKASMASVNLYLSEISYYWRSYCYLLDVLADILLWRGWATIGMFGYSADIWFPIQSIWLFASVALAFEKPSLAPSLILYGLAWIMMSMNYFNSRHIYPWYRVKTFESLVIGLLPIAGYNAETIESTVDLSNAKSNADELQKRKADRMQTFISELLGTGLKAYKLYSGTTVGVETTQDPSWYFLSDKLYYPHMFLKMFCKHGRAFRGFIYWKSYGSFPKTLNFLVLGTLCLIPPVQLVAAFIARILIWTLLGPTMKLVDIFWVCKYYKTNEELMDDIVNDRESQDYWFLPFFHSIMDHSAFRSMAKSGRIAAEDVAKLKAMRETVHGTWSEQVPLADNSSKVSFPLAQSSAKPSSPGDMPARSKLNWKFKPGNRLEGTMIMRCPGQFKSRDGGRDNISSTKKEQ